MDVEVSPAGKLALLGGHLCLDFANTIDWRTGPEPHDFLAAYGDLAAWDVHAGVLSGEEGACLARSAEAHPREAQRSLARALALREAIYRLFSASSAGRQAVNGDLQCVNQALASACSHRRLVAAEGRGFTWSWDDASDLDRAWWPVAQSAGELLAAPELSRVRECSGEGCGWLFLDTSRNRSRRWCAMESCGNRAKARRHYARGAAPERTSGH